MNPFDPRQMMVPRLPAQYGEYEMPQPQPQYPAPPRGNIPGQDEVRRALQIQGILPKKSTGGRGVATPSQDGSIAEVDYELAKSLLAYGIADNPDLFANSGGNPLSAAPVGAPPVGGCVMVAELRFGHDGSNQTVLFDLPPGAIVKTSFAASAAKLYCRLVPKYYKNNDNALVANKRVYLLQPTGNLQLTNQQFNMLPPSILQMQGFAPAGITNLGAPASGWFAEGQLGGGDQFTKPTRRFYGTVKSTDPALPAQQQNTLVPVAWCAVAVAVTGGTSPVSGGGTAAIPLQFTQNGPTGATATGPFPMNTVVPLIDNCQSIEVFNSTNVVGGQEIPFEVIYFLSF